MKCGKTRCWCNSSNWGEELVDVENPTNTDPTLENKRPHKILLMAHKALSGQVPKYIQELIKIKTPCRQLRSRHSGRILCTPSKQRQTLPIRSFSYAASVLWNPLPQHLRDKNSTPTFKKQLKTYLFKKAFNL